MSDQKDTRPQSPVGVNLGLEDFFGYNLKRAYMLVQEAFQAGKSSDGLSARAYSALAVAVETPGITQSALARKLGIERSGLVAMVDELERRGLLNRVPVPGDRRVQALEPTAAGITQFRNMSAQIRAHEDKMLSPLSAEEQAQLMDFLVRIRTAGGE